MNSNPLISIVVPCYNEEEVIFEFYRRIYVVLTTHHLRYELIFVNDGSRDHTFVQLAQLASHDSKIKVINLSRNFGHQVAVSAGIDFANGDVVILIDADLQDPPEMMVEFLNKWQEGYQVVYAVRKQREGETWFKKITAKWFYRLLNWLAEINIPLDTGDFRLMDRSIVNQLKRIKEKHRFLRGLVAWVGFSQIGIEYFRDERYAGTSKYTLKKMFRFAFDGITSFSTKPLRLASITGFAFSLLSIVGIVWALLLKIMTHQTIPGWTSTIIMVLFVGSIQFGLIGILGDYVGRIYDEVRDRPLYIISDFIDGENK